jgi:hypothetical protein
VGTSFCIDSIISPSKTLVGDRCTASDMYRQIPRCPSSTLLRVLEDVQAPMSTNVYIAVLRVSNIFRNKSDSVLAYVKKKEKRTRYNTDKKSTSNSAISVRNFLEACHHLRLPLRHIILPSNTTQTITACYGAKILSRPSSSRLPKENQGPY